MVRRENTSPENAATPASPPAPRKGRHGGLSLRVKGMLSLFAVVVYALSATLVITEERLKLPAVVQDLERLHRVEEQLVQLNIQIARAMLAVSESFFSGQNDARTRQIFIELTPLDFMMKAATQHYQGLRERHESLQKLTRKLAHEPSQGVLAELRTTLHALVVDLDRQAQAQKAEKQKVFSRFQTISDKITLLSMFFMFLGLIVVGAVMTIFFTRLTWDIRRAGARAMAIVKGYRGRTLEVTRGDEVGELAVAINHMQTELRDRERQLEFSRQQQFHQEKMAAVGSLAAAVAHEINNPIMAIAGLAQTLSEDDDPAANGDAKAEMLAMIIDQSKRIALITRQISEFSAPQSPESQLSDLNTLIRNTAGFVRFDRRFRSIELKLELAPDIPAVVIVADHLTQVLINLLLNAADALQSVESRPRVVEVTTRRRSGGIEICVSDNGSGMNEQVLEHAFDEFFTTKPRGVGSGLGLFLCKALVEQNKGKIDIRSTVDVGTEVTVRFNSPEPNKEQA